ncbi:ATP-binding protein [Mycobacterium frederiksbergense]|uniref:sensor histidine kinase n=1 Tax=Mycolicibacterium frederiksbergense TaxID=117567 RepID=UPI0021F26011|nr:ATP-binding protein [Mycolicibacterium frederiksbergense]MCV7044749.1 ATP-binding protein [Mycolicibacterium frederiksbergense]
MATDSTTRDSARRHIVDRASQASFLMRHAANVLVAVTMAVDVTDVATPAGRLLLGAVGAWSAYRLATRSSGPSLVAVDFATTIVVCLALPLLVSGPEFHRSNCAPVAVAGTAVIAFTLSLPARLSLPMTLAIAASYAFGSAQVIGWSRIYEVFNLYYFALQWAASYVMRFVVLRVAGAVDAARNAREAAEVSETVNVAVRAYDREQTRLLHDTVASTLMLAGQGADIPQDRLAAQARRDLSVLNREPLGLEAGPTELVAALQELAAHLNTPVRFVGLKEVWAGSGAGAAVVAASREALTNVDRHAGASLVIVDIDERRVRIADDGVGFDPGQTACGFGLSASVYGRMTQLGGRAAIVSSPGSGTTVELSWANERADTLHDPDRLIARVRMRFVFVMTAYAVLNVLATVPFAVHDDMLQIWLAAGAVACTISALPGLMNRAGPPPVLGMVALMAISVIHTFSIPADSVGTQSHWGQGATGWCLLPLLLRQPILPAAGFLIFYWFVPAMVSVVRNPSTSTLVNIGLGTASILTVQLCVLLIYGLLADAATAAHAETARGIQLLAKDRVAQALTAEYNRRYAQLIGNVVPLLEHLAGQQPLDEPFRRRARVECQRMRVLFDQSASFDHPLLQQLRPAIDGAEARHVDISVHVDGTVPQLEQAVIDRVVAVLGYAMELSRTSARIALVSSSDGLTASIVCPDLDDAERLPELLPKKADDLELTVTGGLAWLTIRCRAGRAGIDASSLATAASTST